MAIKEVRNDSLVLFVVFREYASLQLEEMFI